MADWLGTDSLQPSLWLPSTNILDWWSNVAEKKGSLRKARRTIPILTIWEIWKERNARIFNNRAAAPQELIAKIKEEGRTWFLAGSKCLESFNSV